MSEFDMKVTEFIEELNEFLDKWEYYDIKFRVDFLDQILGVTDIYEKDGDVVVELSS